MTEDELFEDVRYWKGRADAAEARLFEAMDLLKSVFDPTAHDGAMFEAAQKFIAGHAGDVGRQQAQDTKND